MTEKRFIVIDDGLDFMIRDTVTNDNLIDADGVADALNYYEQTCSHYEKRIRELKNEISELKGETRVIVGDLK